MQLGNLHPLLALSKSEVAEAESIFQSIGTHLAQPLSANSVQPDSDVYASFVSTSTVLHARINALAESVLLRQYGIRPGVKLRITDGKTSNVILVESFSLSVGVHLTASPNYWEWRIIGTIAKGRTQTRVELPLRGKLTLECECINNTWKMISSHAVLKAFPQKTLKAA